MTALLTGPAPRRGHFRSRACACAAVPTAEGEQVCGFLKVGEILRGVERGGDKDSISDFLPVWLFATAFHVS